MDHVINSIMSHYEVTLDWLVEDWTSGQYKKLSDCPWYSDCKAMNEAIGVLEKAYYGEKKIMSVRDVIKWRTSFK